MPQAALGRPVNREGINGVRSDLHTLVFAKGGLPDDFFLITAHRERATTDREANVRDWTVESVELEGTVEPVYCAVVPQGHAFTLEDNLLTGNCVGCVKGGMGYWNRIRRDYPEAFAAWAEAERMIGASILKEEVPGPGRQSQPVYLDELDPERGRMEDEPPISCGLTCQGLHLSA